MTVNLWIKLPIINGTDEVKWSPYTKLKSCYVIHDITSRELIIVNNSWVIRETRLFIRYTISPYVYRRFVVGSIIHIIVTS